MDRTGESPSLPLNSLTTFKYRSLRCCLAKESRLTPAEREAIYDAREPRLMALPTFGYAHLWFFPY
jgi:hypothetical protein